MNVQFKRIRKKMEKRGGRERNGHTTPHLPSPSRCCMCGTTAVGARVSRACRNLSTGPGGWARGGGRQVRATLTHGALEVMAQPGGVVSSGHTEGSGRGLGFGGWGPSRARD